MHKKSKSSSLKQRAVVQNLKLQLDIIKEGKSYIAYSPALDLATHGKSVADAKKSFEEAADLFFETIIENNTVSETLSSLGWQKKGKELLPPLIVSRDTRSFSVPLY